MDELAVETGLGGALAWVIGIYQTDLDAMVDGRHYFGKIIAGYLDQRMMRSGWTAS